MSQVPETNPEIATKGPLPAGWITEYSPQWNAWYYVDTKAANPQAVWTHPGDTNANPSTPSPAYTTEPHAGHATTSAPSNPSSAAPGAAAAGQTTNPDTRPLPPGWVSQYSAEHNTFFYVNETAANPGSTVTWKHPAEDHHPPTDLNSPATASTQDHAASSTPSAPGATGHDGAYPNPSTAGATPSDHTQAVPNPQGTPGKENPDKRPLPPGWITKFDESYGVWYYVDTSKPGNAASWEHPADIKTGPAGPGTPGDYGHQGTQAYGGAPHPGDPAHQQYGSQAPAQGGGKGIEGLLGGSAGKMVGGLFGAKGRAQMDMFANKIAPEVNKLKGKQGSSSTPGQGAYGAPPGHAPGGYGAPGQTPGHGLPQGGYPGQAPGQYTPGGPPGQPQGQYNPAYGTPPAGPGYGAPPSGSGYGAPPVGGYGAPPAGSGYGAPPAGQPQHGGGGMGGGLSQLTSLAGKYAGGHGGHGGAHGGQHGGGGGMGGQLGQLTSMAGKFGFGKK